MTKKDKTLSERAVEAQANKTDIAEETGLTPAELKIVMAYVGLCQKRIDLAAVEPFTAAAETHIRMKFPNNDEAVETIDQNWICDKALKFVEDSAFGYPAGNLSKPAPIDDAKNQFARASAQCTASPGDNSREVSYAKQLRWMAQMQVQQEYKNALAPVFDAVHWVHRGFRWQAPDRTMDAVKPDESLAILMQ